MQHELDERLAQARGGQRPIALPELESLYTSGCAEVLELEADAVRTQRRIAELRSQLRHVRTAIEWLQEQEAAAASESPAR
jgi:hypothetical protein